MVTVGVAVAASATASPALPLRIESTEIDGRLRGEIRTVIDHPLHRVQLLADPARLCELVTLLPNIRHCRPGEDRGQLTLHFARRFDQPVADTYAVRFELRTRLLDNGRLEIVLLAADGPMGTTDYRLELAGVAAGERRVSLHVQYGYAYGFSAGLLARAYLATSGRDKVGFTVVGTDAEGSPRYIDGLRGGVERYAMRLYLAIDAYLDVVHEPPPQRRERSLRAWLDKIAGYPRQLAEEDPAAYFEAKRRYP
jgi:hypothetical protein